MKEHGIDAMKYRKHTHLAGVDVSIIASEKGKCLLTIKDAYYSKGVDVSGNRTDGYFLEFVEDVMDMVVNSSNSNWIGYKIELYHDETIRMMGKIVGGIRVKGFKALPNLEPNTPNFDAVKKALQGGNYTIEQVKSKYNVSTEVQKLLENGK